MKLSDLNFGKVEKDSNFNQLGLTAEDYDYALLIVENPRKEFFKLHNKLYSQNFYFKKSKNIISEKASIADYNVIIEDNVVIESNETIYENTLIIAFFYRWKNKNLKKFFYRIYFYRT